MDFLSRSRYIDEAPRPSSGGKSFAFRHEIKLGREPSNILFIRSSYPAYRSDITENLPFWEWRRHSFKDGSKFRTFMCSRGNDRSQDCYACDLQFNQNDPRLGIRNVRYWSVIDLDWYYINRYNERVKPTSRAEERQFEADGLERVFGKAGYLELGKAHNTNLLDIFEQTSNMCVGCLDNDDIIEPGRIEIVAYTCPHCGHVHDTAEQTNRSRDQWRSFGHAPVSCSSCGTRDFPKGEIECNTCDNPRRAEIFDLVFPLVKNGSGKDTSVNLAFGSNVKFIDDYELPDGDMLLKGVNKDGSMDFAGGINEIYNPLDFQEIFKEQLDSEFSKNIIG
jgi:hypothetical protein